MDDLAGQRVTVMGVGRSGGGIGVTRFLAHAGADVLLTDRLDEPDLADTLASIADLVDSGAVRLRLGGHNVSDFTTCDLVVANPAVRRPWDDRFLRAAAAADIPVTTEIALLIERLPTRLRTIGVTGTAGKSTTAAMIAHTLRHTGAPVHLGGNIGGSLLDTLGDIAADDWVVLELSSAMLHWLGQWSPHIAVITNFSPNHLDWHGTLEHYRRSKQRLLDHQRPGDFALLGTPDLPFTANKGVHTSGPHGHPHGLAPDLALRVPGAHNAQNAMLAAAAAAVATGASADDMLRSLESFTGLEHRLEFVGAFDGVRFYNDSKSTTPRAVVMALAALESHGRIHLILGGYDKGVNLGELVGPCARCASVLTIGDTGRALASLLAPAARYCHTLDRAVEHALSGVHPGDTVLLSPGCASWDQFRNFQERGMRFKELVRAWANAPAAERIK